MHNVQSMQILQCPCSLRKEKPSLRLREDLLAVLIKEEVAVLRVLEDHIHASFFTNGVPKRSAVRIVEIRVDAYLSLYEFQLCLRWHVSEVYLHVSLITTLIA